MKRIDENDFECEFESEKVEKERGTEWEEWKARRKKIKRERGKRGEGE